MIFEKIVYIETIKIHD